MSGFGDVVGFVKFRQVQDSGGSSSFLKVWRLNSIVWVWGVIGTRLRCSWGFDFWVQG